MQGTQQKRARRVQVDLSSPRTRTGSPGRTVLRAGGGFARSLLVEEAVSSGCRVQEVLVSLQQVYAVVVV